MADVAAFVKLGAPIEVSGLGDIVAELGGSITVTYADQSRMASAAQVAIPVGRIDDLDGYLPDHSRVYTGPIPRSTLRGYPEDLRMAGRVWNAYLKPASPMTPDEAGGLQRAVQRSADL